MVHDGQRRRPGYAKKKNQDFLFDAEVMFIRKYLLDQN